MAIKKITLPIGTFSSNLAEELERRLEIGVVNFSYIYSTSTDTHKIGEVRQASGTRNLSMSFVTFNDIPWGGSTPPSHVLTYLDIDKGTWRCCNRHMITYVSPDIYVEV